MKKAIKLLEVKEKVILAHARACDSYKILSADGPEKENPQIKILITESLATIKALNAVLNAMNGDSVSLNIMAL